MKKVFIFDLFGTLINTYEKEVYYNMVREMAESLELDFEKFQVYWNEETYDDRMLGKFKDNYENLMFISNKYKLNLSDKNIEKAVKIRSAFTKKSLMLYREDLIEMLEEIKIRGYKLALISDCSPDVPEIWNEMEYSKFFDEVVFSCSVKLKKPDERIYNLVLDKLGEKAEDCYYIGDGGSFELTGAKKVGMHPILIKSLEDEKKDIYKKYLDDFDDDRIYGLRELEKYS